MLTEPPAEDLGPLAARVLAGHRLRKLRERKGIEGQEAAYQVGLARATLWRIEKGDPRCRLKPGDMEQLGRLYGADQETLDMLVGLARRTRERGWLAGYSRVLAKSRTIYHDLEAYAVRVRCYAHATVPELLQTDDYGDTLIAASRPLPSAERSLTELRIARRQLLTTASRSTRFEFLLDEAMLHRTVGPPTVMPGQLRALARSAGRPRVSVEVVPYTAGPYSGLDVGAFSILDYPTDETFGGLPTTAYLHRFGESTAFDTPHDVDAYCEHWRTSRDRALDPCASLALITDIADHAAVDTTGGFPLVGGTDTEGAG